MKLPAFFLLSALLSWNARAGAAGDDYVHIELPRYPPASVRLNETGTVRIQVFVKEDGRAGEAFLHASSGYPRLDKAALSAVRRWAFSPARRGNSHVIVPVRFDLIDWPRN
ncbi:MAG: energy transducer TonB [Azoarcus sp.]|nr:energy transducer TonB [Azoarcus sp.]